MISLIVAIDNNNVIGKDNKMPWRLPLDLANFKKITNEHIVIMGRKTFESMGKPLPGRTNWIITRDKDYRVEGCRMFYSIDEVISNINDEEVFIIGGEKIYSEFFPLADKLYVTLIDENFIGDTFFPEIKAQQWNLTSKIKGERNEKNPYDYHYMIFERV